MNFLKLPFPIHMSSVIIIVKMLKRRKGGFYEKGKQDEDIILGEHYGVYLYTGFWFFSKCFCW